MWSGTRRKRSRRSRSASPFRSRIAAAMIADVTSTPRGQADQHPQGGSVRQRGSARPDQRDVRYQRHAAPAARHQGRACRGRRARRRARSPQAVARPYGSRTIASISICASFGRRATWICGGASRRRVCEPVGVRAIHRHEVVHVGEIDGRLHDIVEGRAGRAHDRVEATERAVGLRRHVAVDQLPRFRVDRYLSGDEQKVAGPHGLRVGADRGRCAGRRDRGPRHVRSGQAAFVIRFERMQRVQTRTRLTRPPTTARTDWMLAWNRRRVTLWA